MRKFWSLISNGKYRVGCTGQTVYIYDQNGTDTANEWCEPVSDEEYGLIDQKDKKEPD